MSGDVETGSSRPRPLSGGFWTLLSWLRREEHSSSNESLSSAGSDRTTVSFAFLAPAHYHSKVPPIVLPPPGPPTDTYKKRVRERNLRRQYDRDTTLHRKYGLFRGEGVSGYDTISLPAVRRANSAGGDRLERERRATSECLQRRAAHVPGKRRAPAPPARLHAALDPALTVTRRHTRKRPAPQPPSQTIEKSKENIFTSSHDKNKLGQMNSPTVSNAQQVKSHAVSLEAECKSEKYTKKDPKDSKIRSEKSFLKQIFDNKKRNSAIDISTVKVLPSISELDKQAAEIIENKKLRNNEEKNRLKSYYELNDSLIRCSKCFKESCFCKNDDVGPSGSNIINHKNASTIYTQTESGLHNNAINGNAKLDEKQKLKDMLKEMKDSLPKRPKHETKANEIQRNTKLSTRTLEEDNGITDTPTLKIGSLKSPKETKNPVIRPITSTDTKDIISKIKSRETIFTTPNVNVNALIIVENKVNIVNNTTNHQNRPNDAIVKKEPDNKSREHINLHTPLKISSLLNPIYVPKNIVLPQNHLPRISVSEGKPEDKKSLRSSVPDPIYVKTADTVRDIILNSAISGSSTPTTSGQKEKLVAQKLNKPNNNKESPKEITKNESKVQKTFVTDTSNKNVTNVERVTEHSRRRELVNQLEQSIAKGDERAAAEAATKLAQLRLSCSVLSFSSQILTAPSTSSAKLQETPTSAIQNIDIKVKNLQANSKPPPAILQKQAVPSKVTEADLASGDKAINTSIKKNLTVNENKELKAPPQPSTSQENKAVDNMAKIDVWIEDKEKARGPIQLHVRREASVGDLRRQAEQFLGLPARLQRWIVGRALCTDDNALLITLAGSTFNAPFYLCLVESDSKNNEVNTENVNLKKTEAEVVQLQDNNKNKTSDVYSELVNLERQALVPNTETFECEICMEQCDPGNGVVLRECVHQFCKDCLSDVIRHCGEPTVSCPATGCPGELHEREVRALVSVEEYQRWLARGLAAAESGTRNAFHCRTTDCTGWALCEIEVRRFPCPVCKHINCVPCQAIHENESCEQYQAKLQQATANSTANKTDEGTQALIDSLISRGEAVQCPECSAVITKKWGCDWVKCSACKTEICWVTKGRRWGPGGRGDTSGGCRCGVDGKRCHPSCAYCH